MKKHIILISIMSFFLSLFIGGCAGLKPIEEAAILSIIRVGGYDFGYYIGKSKTDLDDIAIADAYKLARTGSLSPQELSEAFAKFKIENPLLAGNLMLILQSMGAIFDEAGTLVSLSKIPVIYWDTAAEGYVLGYEFGLIGKKDVVKKVSAVKALILKK
jgi:hypothetical protein